MKRGCPTVSSPAWQIGLFGRAHEVAAATGWLHNYFELLDLTRKQDICPAHVTDKAHRHLETWMHNQRARKNRLTDPVHKIRLTQP